MKGRGPIRAEGPVVVAVLLVGLSAVGGVPPAAGIAASVAAVAAGWAMRRYLPSDRAGLGLVPPMLALGALSAGSRPTLPAELLAGVGALALLYWLAADSPPQGASQGPAIGLVVPGLGLALALLVPQFLAVGGARIGLAEALLALLLLVAGWAIVATGARPPEAAPS